MLMRAITLSIVAKREYPYPPLELADRVGSLADATDPFAYYDKLGRETRDGIVNRLPSDWTFNGKRILDFGCGAGRTLRHFSTEATEADLLGCDIDETSIRWMEDHLCPPFHVFANGAEPPLDQPDASFDLIWAISVFTHLASNWSRWLVELNRLLKSDGLLFVTFMGSGMSQEIAGEPWDEGSFGMNIIKYGQNWDLGGPMVIHSPWWIEEHWGRAFEILSLSPDRFGGKPWLDHGFVLMRKQGQPIDPEELERIIPGDERETRAIVHNVEQLHKETSDLRAGLNYQLEKGANQRRLLEAQIAEHQREQAEGRRKHKELGRALLAVEADLANAQNQIAQLHATNADVKKWAEKWVTERDEQARRSERGRLDLENRLRRAELTIADVTGSMSWRLTGPLRRTKRLLRGR
jgi:SAM-dependent methyltransferase